MLNAQWGTRVENWIKKLKALRYRSLGTVEVAGFVTTELLTAEEALTREFTPMPAGTPWGNVWEYAWFKATVVVPPEAKGQRFVIKAPADIAGTVYVNGVCAGDGGLDHKVVTLATDAEPGQSFDILIEHYASHGELHFGWAPLTPEEFDPPLPAGPQHKVAPFNFGILEEEIYQLWLDAVTLMALGRVVEPNTLRRAKVEKALKEFTCILDIELPRDEMLKTARAARGRLAPELACVNGSTAPTLYCFGHSHLDTAWLWPLAETFRKSVRTSGNQLALAGEYPEHRFLMSQAYQHWALKQNYPEIYARVKEAVLAGNIVAEGGMWVEPDTNITSGESLIRQFLFGKTFFREEYGVDNELLWLPDVFGYSAALPQIMAGCEVPYFSSCKIFWNYEERTPFPHTTFQWQGIDGTRILSHLHTNYNATTDPMAMNSRWKDRAQQDDDIDGQIVPFGHGDGGSGPSRDHLEFLRRQHDLEGMPKAVVTSPVTFMHELEERRAGLHVFSDELYFAAHRGTYTSQGRTKRGNRKGEFALREAEIWSVAAAALKGFQIPVAEMWQAWNLLLLNQFHDILPGTSISRVHNETEEDYATILKIAADSTASATSALASDGGDAVTAFNSLSWDRDALVPLPDGVACASAQDIDGQLYAEISIPSCGWTTRKQDNCAGTSGNTIASEGRLENEHLRVEFNELGEIVSLFDKDVGRELTAGPCNQLKMYRDTPTAWDAWDIEEMYEDTPVALSEPATIAVLSAGPLAGVLRIERTINQSKLTQDVWLRRNSRMIEFRTSVDWRDRHKLLKVNFPTDINAREALYEIQFGHISRPNHKSHVRDAERYEVSHHKWAALCEESRGVAVLNDCKYGVNVEHNSINVSLLRAPIGPDTAADQGEQVFTYAFYAWNSSLAESDLVRNAYELNTAPVVTKGDAGEASLFTVDSPNVIIDTVKPAEDGSGDVIVRLYESKRTATRCKLSTSLAVTAAALTNMLEEKPAELAVADGSMALDLRTFEVATVRLTLDK